MNKLSVDALGPTIGTRSLTKAHWHLVVACSVGNALEMYDFTVYSFFSIVIGKLFFPAQSPYGSLLLAIGTFGIGFLMRPLGALILGSYADRRGRKSAMTLTIWLMAAGTLCVALAPGYTTAGALGGVIVVLGRIVQGFSLGGEIGASTAMLLESGSRYGRGFRVACQGASQGVAALLGAATGATLYTALSEQQILAWGWRLPFFLGLLIAPVGLYIRSRVDETLVETAAETQPLIKLFSEHKRKILRGALSIVSGTISMYLILLFMPTYLIQVVHLPATLSLMAGVVAGGTLSVFGVLSGLLADRMKARKPLAIAAVATTTILAYPVFWLINSNPGVALVLVLTFIITASSSIGMAPVFLLLTEMFPPGVRASGLAVVYSLGVTIIGGTAQFIATWLLSETHNPLSLSFYMIACGCITLVAMSTLPETGKTD